MTVLCAVAMRASTTCLSRSQTENSTGHLVAAPVTIPACLNSVYKKFLGTTSYDAHERCHHSPGA